jgi:hypothetical protein
LSDFTLFPNPVKSELTMASTARISKLEIYNIAGQLVKEASNLEDTSIVSLEGLISGVYFVKLASQDGIVSTQKIIKD